MVNRRTEGVRLGFLKAVSVRVRIISERDTYININRLFSDNKE